jgi:hypothetical protein
MTEPKRIRLALTGSRVSVEIDPGVSLVEMIFAARVLEERVSELIREAQSPSAWASLGVVPNEAS